MEYLKGVLLAIFEVSKDLGVYIFIGFIITGIIKTFLKDNFIEKHLGRKGLLSVIKASIFGIPLPLCSCSVIPIAHSLKNKGASNGAISSFLISAPETGVDSILVTYGMLGWVYTIVRPITALITSILAGIVENLFNKESIGTHSKNNYSLSKCQSENCSMEQNNNAEQDTLANNTGIKTFWNKVLSGIRYSFADLLPDISFSLAIGIILTGVISFVLPKDFFLMSKDYPIVSMVLMLIVGMPIYICATSSTPIAASLLLKGLNPGAVLVFLLAGPATNMITMTTVSKIMGKRGLALYILTITLSSLLAGYLLDLIFLYFSIDPVARIQTSAELFPEWIKFIFAILLCTYLSLFLVIKGIKKLSTLKPKKKAD